MNEESKFTLECFGELFVSPCNKHVKLSLEFSGAHRKRLFLTNINHSKNLAVWEPQSRLVESSIIIPDNQCYQIVETQGRCIEIN